MNYIDQRRLDAEMSSLQRDCAESLWALSDPKLYEAEIERLKARKAALAVLMAEDSD